MNKVDTEVRAKLENWQIFVDAVKRFEQQENLGGQTGLALMILADRSIATRGGQQVLKVEPKRVLRYMNETGAAVKTNEAMPSYPSLSYWVTEDAKSVAALDLNLDSRTFDVGDTAKALGFDQLSHGMDTGLRIFEQTDHTLIQGIELVQILSRPYVGEKVIVQTIVRRYDPLSISLLAKNGKRAESWVWEEVTIFNHSMAEVTRLVSELISGNPQIGVLLSRFADMAGTKGLRDTVSGITAEDEETLREAILHACWSMNRLLKTAMAVYDEQREIFMSEELLRTAALAAARSLTLTPEGVLKAYPGGLAGLVRDLSAHSA